MDMIKRMLLSMAIAGTGLAVCAETVHERPDTLTPDAQNIVTDVAICDGARP